jgi:hypothetical protein
MQYTTWSDVVMCRALLGELLGRDPKPGTAGCVGATGTRSKGSMCALRCSM